MSDQGREPPVAGDVAGPTVSAQWVVAVARQAISEMAPRELAEFDSVADSWLTDKGQRRRRMPGAAVGSGMEVMLLSELIFPVISAALGEVLGNAAWEQIRPRRKARHRRSATRSATDAEVRLTRQQSEALPAAYERNGVLAGLSAATAAKLADAILAADGPAATPGTPEAG